MDPSGEHTRKLAKEYKKQEEENLFNELMKFPGVGAKVADCIMLFATPCKNRFPIDTWIKKIMEEKYAMKVESKKDKDKVQKFVEVKFSPYAGIAQQYLFYSAIALSALCSLRPFRSWSPRAS